MDKEQMNSRGLVHVDLDCGEDIEDEESFHRVERGLDVEQQVEQKTRLEGGEETRSQGDEEVSSQTEL